MIAAVVSFPRILVIESHALIARGLCEVLLRSENFTVLGDLESIPVALDSEFNPDVVLLDIDGLTGDLSTALIACKKAYPTAHLCVLTAYAQEEVLQRCLAGGAEGYIVKDSSPLEFVKAVRSVAEGIPYVDPCVAGSLLRRRSVTNWRIDRDELSQRDVEIICLIAQGFSNRDISDRISLSEKTVKNYISRIFSKLNISTRTQAAAYAFRSGLA